MYFNSKLFKKHFKIAKGTRTLDMLLPEVKIGLFALQRFEQGKVEDEVMSDYWEVCKWMGKSPLIYFVN